jgi:hydrogenase maturation factor HypF (carbamoyltransferase family)
LSRSPKSAKDEREEKAIAMYLIPCSCGTSFVVSENYDRQGTHLRSYLICPQCGKRHDPKNRILQLGYQRNGYWKVEC